VDNPYVNSVGLYAYTSVVLRGQSPTVNVANTFHCFDVPVVSAKGGRLTALQTHERVIVQGLFRRGMDPLQRNHVRNWRGLPKLPRRIRLK